MNVTRLVLRTACDCLLTLAAAGAVYVGLVALGPKAHAQVVGVHTVTHHFVGGGHPTAPGLYLRVPVRLFGGDELTFGGYANSLVTPQRQVSLYIAESWSFGGRYAVALGLISGYERRRYYDSNGRYLGTWGLNGAPVMPLVAASVAWPEAQRFLGVTPRLTLIPAAVHLSLERSWK